MMQLRKSSKEDLGLIIYFINQLAMYQKMSDEVIVTKESLSKWMFEKKVCECILAYIDDKPAGFILYFFNFSTFVGKGGIYIEDLFVLPEYRGRKIGISLFEEVVKLAIENDCGRIEWSCLKWNKPSIEFYNSLGAICMDEWDTYRLTADRFNKIV